MMKETHKLISEKAVEWLDEVVPTALVPCKIKIGQAAHDTDDIRDVEYVNVEYNIGGSHGRDDPHANDYHTKTIRITIPNPFGPDKEIKKTIKIPYAGFEEDEWHKESLGRSFTSMNHFIDIKKDKGTYDDYDGYSYENGSARNGQHEEIVDESDCPFVSYLDLLSPFKVDEGINWWFNDEYVHVAGRSWYNNCSPAMSQYCYPTSGTINNQLKKRFPLAKWKEAADRGIPYSTFMPIDNLVKWHYRKYLQTGYLEHLGHVLHGVQDSSVPHHAAGYLGNWHSAYEGDLEHLIQHTWINSQSFKDEIVALFHRWNIWCRTQSQIPSSLKRSDTSKTPRVNWPVDMLVTWLALHACNVYEGNYSNFSSYLYKPTVMRSLAVKAIAMSMLILRKTEASIFDYIMMRTLTSPQVVIGKRMFKDVRTAAGASSATIHRRRTTTTSAVATPQKIGYFVTDKKILAFRTLDEAQAKAAKEMLLKCKVKNLIKVGNKKQPKCYILLGEKSLARAHKLEKTVNIDPAKIRLVQGKRKIQNGHFPRYMVNWYLAMSNRHICTFGRDGISAGRAYYLIKENKLKKFCTLGTFKYFRR